LALGINSLNAAVTSCVINSGLIYGMGEDVLFPLFKQALEQKQPLAIYGGGGNRIPTIHVDDLAQLTFDLAFSNASGFFYAADHASVTQGQLITLISQTIGNGKVDQLPIENAFLHEHFDVFTADIAIDGKSLSPISAWKYREGLAKNIGNVVGEFNESRGLKPNKILIHGTPASGKSKLAEMYF
jgi:adenylate kinase